MRAHAIPALCRDQNYSFEKLLCNEYLSKHSRPPLSRLDQSDSATIAVSKGDMA
jgi:hypothetical protein